MYAIIAFVMIACSVLAVTTRKILRAASYLMFTLFAAAGLYFMLGYEFLGAVQIAVYAGGILVLFVFAIFLTGKPGDNAEKLASKSRIAGIVAALAVFCAAGYALATRLMSCTAMPAMKSQTMTDLGQTLMGTGYGQYLLPFEAVSVLLLACVIGGVVIARKR